MNSRVYGKLAVTNLRNNRKTYVPYILTAILTVMMYYIIDTLARNDAFGDGNLRLVLRYAVSVVIVFAVIFLFYTNSFLIKRRKKEIGVYNILGMGKRHIAKMLVVETLITAVSSILIGLAAGAVFSKLMYLVLLKILRYDVRMEFAVSGRSIINTLILFIIIFSMTLFYNLLQIKLANPVELLRGANQGEREPKTKWLMTIFGVVTIGAGYYIAITTESPLSAIGAFFIAVICVILGTYALFTAGSIALLKALRKNKNYYYKTKNFTAVSGMIYRMKQNAVGLANICILSTMVLVMISTSVSLYLGMDDVLMTRYPQEFEARSSIGSEQNINALSQIIKEETEKEDVEIKNEVGYKYTDFTMIDGKDGFSLTELESYASSDLTGLTVLTQEEYNRLTGDDISLAPDEVLLFKNTKDMYGKDTIKIGSSKFHIMKELEDFPLANKSSGRLYPTYFMITDGEDIIQRFFEEAYGDSNDNIDFVKLGANISYTVSFDLKGDEKAVTRSMEQMKSRIEQEVEGSMCDSRELNKEWFYMMYGGLLFIGIYLGSMFLMATVLIIYYKQISEGYDDKERYQIMQKVGMGKKEVKRSIRSQVVSVFFLPLVAAIIHITVAFGVITKLLAVLNLVNVPLFLTCTIVTIAVFAVFYAIVYGLTAREYYKIVN